VIGYPLKLNNLHSQWTDQVCFFFKQVKEAFPHYNVILWDERNSTKKATEHLKFNLGLKSSEIKKQKDKFSALVILQDYLNSLERK
jgi:putative transcription antitermination factor YqgF